MNVLSHLKKNQKHNNLIGNSLVLRLPLFPVLAVSAADEEADHLSSPSPAKLSKTENHHHHAAINNGANRDHIPTCSLDLHSNNSVVTVRALLKSTRAQDEGDDLNLVYFECFFLLSY